MDGFDYKAFEESLPERLRQTPQERWRKRQAEVRFRARIRNLWKAAMKRAAAQDVPFTITTEWIKDGLTRVNECEATGLPFGVKRCFNRSLDRIKPERGYTPENCRWVIYAYNSAKGVGSDEDVMVMAEALVRQKALKDGTSST